MKSPQKRAGLTQADRSEVVARSHEDRQWCSTSTRSTPRLPRHGLDRGSLPCSPGGVYEGEAADVQRLATVLTVSHYRVNLARSGREPADCCHHCSAARSSSVPRSPASPLGRRLAVVRGRRSVAVRWLGKGGRSTAAQITAARATSLTPTRMARRWGCRAGSRCWGCWRSPSPRLRTCTSRCKR